MTENQVIKLRNIEHEKHELEEMLEFLVSYTRPDITALKVVIRSDYAGKSVHIPDNASPFTNALFVEMVKMKIKMRLEELKTEFDNL
jgi:hypothetical protein